MIKMLIVLAAMAAPAVASAQAFGVKMGSPASAYNGKQRDNPGFYEVTPPEPHAEFETYMAVATPETGICKVVALGRTHRNDGYGSSVRSSFNSLSAALTTRYGQSETFDFLRRGAIWDEPREWVWSIYKKERELSSYWTSGRNASLPPSIQAVELTTKSVSPSSGAYLSLAYEFSNFGECKRVMEAQGSRGL